MVLVGLNGALKGVRECDMDFVEVMFVARMSKKVEEEYAFFIKKGIRRRICYCEMCKACVHDCKQSFRVQEISCPHYITKK